MGLTLLSTTLVFAKPVKETLVNVAFTETGPSPCKTEILWIFNGSVVPTASNPSIPITNWSNNPCIEIVEHFVNSGSDNRQVFKKAAVLNIKTIN